MQVRVFGRHQRVLRQKTTNKEQEKTKEANIQADILPADVKTIGRKSGHDQIVQVDPLAKQNNASDNA